MLVKICLGWILLGFRSRELLFVFVLMRLLIWLFIVVVMLFEVRLVWECFGILIEVLFLRVFCFKILLRLFLDKVVFIVCEMVVDMVVERVFMFKEINLGLLIVGFGVGGFVVVSFDVCMCLECVWWFVFDGCLGCFLGGMIYW